MSVHIEAKKGDIADTILLPGDPLRAKYIAENYLDDVIQYNNVRGMLGYTGTYKGKRVSVQGTGMVVPSMLIYVNDIIQEYDVIILILFVTCSGMKVDVNIRDIILAQGATHDSQTNKMIFGNIDYASLADFNLLKNAYEIAKDKSLNTHVGNVFTSDTFYRDNAIEVNDLLSSYNILGIEMEAAALYTLAAKYNCEALAILTVSDHIITGEATSSKERQSSFNDMMEVALETALQ